MPRFSWLSFCHLVPMAMTVAKPVVAMHMAKTTLMPVM